MVNVTDTFNISTSLVLNYVQKIACQQPTELLLCFSEEGEESSKTNDQTWGDTDRDYTYDEVFEVTGDGA